jgi:VWFA-related protein
MRASLGLLLLACAVAAIDAQAPAANPPQQPTFRGGINYVRVDMYATRDGVPITDLRPEDIEVREDGTPQRIKDFEYIQVRRNTPQAVRIEPNSVAESRAMAADARARVFVLFLDTYHITPEGLVRMRTPLVRFIERLMGPDDLVAIMTPEMSAGDITFARRTTVLDGILQKEWAWSRRERIEGYDDKDRLYGLCYKVEIAQEMAARRREKLSLDALDDLVTFLEGVREERKAIVTISEGWRLYKPSRELAEMTVKDPPLPPVVGGTQRRADGSVDQNAPRSECEQDRMLLSRVDHERREDDLTLRANRSNVTFYPVHPRGLVVFDESIGSPTYRGPLEDAANLRDRLRSLRTLAIDTDGTAVVDTNDIDGALKRIADDLSSYYLLGYESTNSKLDGKFRSISVRVNRPGTTVRARKGYRGLRPEEVKTPSGPAPAAAAAAAPVTVTIDPRSPFRLRPSAWTSGGSGKDAIWIVGEMDAATRRDPVWAGGATAELSVASSGSGARVASLQVPIAAADGRFSVQLPADIALAPGDYVVRVRITPQKGQSLPLSDLVRLSVPSAAMPLGQGVLFRRGPSTGTRYLATADPRFQRSDRLRLEVPTRVDGAGAAQLRDATGKTIPVAVTVSERRDDSGDFRWLVVDATLAPLAAGDYVLELTVNGVQQLTPFRVIP